MLTRLDELLIASIRPHNLAVDQYVDRLQMPVARLNKEPHVAAHEELARIVRSWPEQDSPLSRCRVLSVLKHLKFSLPMPENSLGATMLAVVEGTIPPRVRYIARLHEMGFSAFIFAFDLFEHTLKAFWKEKGVMLDEEYRQEMLEIYLLAVYHLGRSRTLPNEQREIILLGVHDSYNAIYLRPKGRGTLGPQDFATAYQRVVEQWIKSAGDVRRQSPSYALVRNVFNLLGLNSPLDRMTCATLLEASASHMLELGEVLTQTRASAGMQ